MAWPGCSTPAVMPPAGTSRRRWPGPFARSASRCETPPSSTTSSSRGVPAGASGSWPVTSWRPTPSCWPLAAPASSTPAPPIPRWRRATASRWRFGLVRSSPISSSSSSIPPRSRARWAGTSWSRRPCGGMAPCCATTGARRSWPSTIRGRSWPRATSSRGASCARWCATGWRTSGSTPPGFLTVSSRVASRRSTRTAGARGATPSVRSSRCRRRRTT